MACRTGCKTKDHASYGECLRSANVSWRDGTKHLNWDGELESYRSAREQGIQPASTRLADTRKALDMSDRLGSAFDAGKGVGV